MFGKTIERNKHMITSKERAYLRALANGIDPIFQIGKSGITDELLNQLALALEARELIKIHILETAMLDTKACCNELAEKLSANPVQAIGSKVVLYKRAVKVENQKIEFPDKKKKK